MKKVFLILTAIVCAASIGSAASIKGTTPWYVIDGVHLDSCYNNFANIDDKGEIAGLAIDNFVKGVPLTDLGLEYITSGTSGKAGIMSRLLDYTNVTTAYFAGNVIAEQDAYYPIYAITVNWAEGDNLHNVFCMAKKKADGKNYLLRIDPDGSSYKFTEFWELSGVSHPITAMTAANDGTIYYIEENADNAILYSMMIMNYGEFKWPSGAKIGELGVGSVAAGHNALASDPYTGELVWLQDDNNGTKTIRLIDTKTGKSEKVADHNFTANGLFQLNNLNELTLKSNDESKGYASFVNNSSCGYYAENSKVQVTANPQPGCHFVKWNDGNKDNPRMVTIGEDPYQYLTAEFEYDAGLKLFPVKINGVQLHEKNAEILPVLFGYSPVKKGSIYYNGQTNTLVLDEVNYEGSGTAIEVTNNDYPVTILVKGKCEIKTTSPIAATILTNGTKPVTYTTADKDSKLFITSAYDGIANKSDVTLLAMALSITAENDGLASVEGKETVTSRGSNLVIQGKNISIGGMKDLQLEYCDLLSPSDVSWDPNNHFIGKAGYPTTAMVIISSMPQVRVTPADEGAGNFIIKDKDGLFEFTDIGWFAAGTEITITAKPAKNFNFSHWDHDSYWGDDSMKDQWLPATIELTTDGTNQEFKAIFYYKAKTSATWYAVKNGDFISFKMSDGAAKVATASEPNISGFYAGDWRNGNLDYQEDATFKQMPFSGLTDGEPLAGKDKVKDIIDDMGAIILQDMAYDPVHNAMYGHSAEHLYKINYSKKQIEHVGVFYDSEGLYTKMVALAVDNSGNLYALSYGNPAKLYKISKMDQKKESVSVVPVGNNQGNIGLSTYSTEHQSMAFDRSTGELFWASNTYMRIIDLKTTRAYICGDIGCTHGAQGSIRGLNRKEKYVAPDPDPDDDDAVENITATEAASAQKILHEGHLYIIKEGKIYTSQGQLIK